MAQSRLQKMVKVLVKELFAPLFSKPYQDAKKLVLRAFDEAYVDFVIRRSKGNMSLAARFSGMTRQNFRRLAMSKTTKMARDKAAKFQESMDRVIDQHGETLSKLTD